MNRSAVATPGYDLWFVEHGIVEWATALAYLATALIAAGLWPRRGRPAPLEGLRPYLWIVLPFALVAFLDELSFGAHFIGYRPPVVLGYPINSVHDLLSPAAKAFRLATGLALVPAVLVLTGAAAVAAAALAWALRRRLAALGRAAGAAGMRPAWLSLGCAALLGVLAVMIDNAGAILMPGREVGMGVAEELAELATALTLLAGILWLQRFRARVARGVRPAKIPRPKLSRELLVRAWDGRARPPGGATGAAGPSPPGGTGNAASTPASK